MMIPTHYRQRLTEKGLSGIIGSRWRWYKQAFQMNNWVIGKLIELCGNKITIQGITLCVDNPLVTTRHKSSLYFGMYEISERRLAQLYIDPSLPIIEVGGSIGGVACTTNKLLLNPSDHVVVECNPIVLPTLERNRELNKCKFAIEPFALAYGSNTISFAIDMDHFMLGSLARADGKQISVPTITLKRILDKYGFKTINLISDSEGGEVEMVEHEPDLLRQHVKCLILETHEQLRGREPIARTLSALSDLGFRVQDQGESTLAMTNCHLANESV
jgi:FkbM family methyltransferase